MPYSPFQIARFFIEKADEEGKDMSPMKLIKLEYISHAWNLAFYNEPLLTEQIQAWKWGPVIESLYHGFKRFGTATIPKREAETLPPIEASAPTLALLEKIWQKYGSLSAIHLSSLTHQPDTPWYKVWHEEGGKDNRWTPIPDSQIKDFYQAKLANPAAHGSGH